MTESSEESRKISGQLSKASLISEVLDDKLMVVWCLSIIAIVSMFVLPEPETIVSNVVSGMLGIAVGKKLK